MEDFNEKIQSMLKTKYGRYYLLFLPFISYGTFTLLFYFSFIMFSMYFFVLLSLAGLFFITFLYDKHLSNRFPTFLVFLFWLAVFIMNAVIFIKANEILYHKKY